MTPLQNWLAYSLWLWQQNNPLYKTACIASLAWACTPCVEFLNIYVYDDWQFFISLCIVIGIDTVLGVWQRWRSRTLSSRGFGRVFAKVGFYSLFLIATHILATHKVRGQLNTLLTWVDSACYSLVLVREFLSILEHSAALGIFTPPAWLLQRLQQFAEQGPADNQTPNPSKPTV